MHRWKLQLERKRCKVVLAAILWVGLSTGCSVLGRTAVPTPFPEDFIETAIRMTVEAGDLATSAAILNPSTPEATETPPPPPDVQVLSPTVGSDNPGETGQGSAPQPAVEDTQPPPTPIPTSTPGMPESAIQITSPGPMSKITSALNVAGSLHTEPDGHVLFEVWLEPLTPDGEPRLLMRELQNFISDPTPWIYISKEFDIQISRLSEFAQLRVSTYDADNRMVALASVDLLLLSIGDAELNPPGDLQERIVLLEPLKNQLIQGGTAFVSGLVYATENEFLTVNMVAPDGKVVGIQQVAVTPSPEAGYVPFSIEVPYYVSESTRVRLAVSESIGRIPGITHLTSIEVLLSP